MSVPTPEQSEHLSMLEDVANLLQKAQINIKKCPKARLSTGYVKARLKTIEDYWNDFREANTKLTKCTPREQRGTIKYFLNKDYYAIEELYLSLHASLTDHLMKGESNQRGDESLSFPDASLARLPKIQLPVFSGKYEDWSTYHDLFVALVHNTNISNVQKLHYLKGSVSGEAEILLRQIQITESNYTQAWEKLKGRFGNKKMIVNSILKKLFCNKKVANQSANNIKSVLDMTTECINNLNNVNINTDSWDPIIIFLVGQKLGSELLQDWEEHTYTDNPELMPTWNDMQKFLESKFRTLELVAPITTTSRDKSHTHKAFHITTKEDEVNHIQSAHANIKYQVSCNYCNQDHYICHCKDFAKQPVEERRNHVKINNLCFNCLVPNHSVYRCKQRTTCRVCRRRHHTLLHQNKEDFQEKETLLPRTQTQREEQSQPQQIITSAHLSREQPGQEVLLATAQVTIQAKNGQKHLLRALIDQGSQVSFVSARVVELLSLSKTSTNGVVSGVGEETQIPIKHVVDLSVLSRYNPNEVIRVKAYVMKTITSILPSKQSTMNWPELQTLVLADTTYDTPGKIDVLLGADVFCKIIKDGLIKMPDGVVAQNTILGWILSGQQQGRRDTYNDHRNFISMHVTTMVAPDNDMLKKLWEIDGDLYKQKRILTKEEEQCEEIYKNTTRRDDSGRYIVQLPLKQTIEETVNLCGNTKQQAINRFKQLERKFERNDKLKKEYTKAINEYKDMGHMVKSDTSDDHKYIYLPHHAVIREDKDTTKVRVVFDASAKGSNGNSLNDTMMIGPVLQPDLRSLIIKWRMHKICVIGDIIKMYRMVRMTEEHTNLQRIIWRDTPNDEFESYNLTTLTFGTAAAPYLAVRTLNQIADDERTNYPDSAPVIKQSFYMDDLMVGHENEEKTIEMCDEIRTILKKGGFEMQKWSSNSEKVIEHLQEYKDINTKDKIEIKQDKIIKILGLTWNRKEDIFEITVNLPDVKYPTTKRSVLSDIARLFDPFGWLAPVVVTAKVFIQKLWQSKVGWDDKLPTDLYKQWIAFRDDLIHLQTTRIPRWLKLTPQNYKDVQLHGFADASTHAYAAVTYLKIVENDEVHITIIASRTRVAPVKQISLPRLELCAAALLAELINTIEDQLNIPKDKIFAWTDSMVVLSWLQSQPNRWRTFVANRVTDITRVVDSDRWSHVRSADNPADVATRGVKACDLATLELWWTGPKWLKQKKLDLEKPDIPETQIEIKSAFHITLEDKPIWERFSTLSKMKRILAYCRRMMKGVKPETEEKYLTPKEMTMIEENCIRYYQHLKFEKEIEDLKKNGQVKKRSLLITLSPFLDENGLIRVGGRLQNASIPESSKHPIIIPGNTHITKLLIHETHLKTLHGGIQLMMAYLTSRYWIFGLKSAVKKCIHNCKTCIVEKAKVKYQFMGQLPSMRVNQHRAFINSGVDYAGPVFIRSSRGRGHQATKGYICLFICMSTRAIHLEAVTDLTSQAFIAAFRRFVARRGHCSHLWSDNGTNFVGAAKELKSLFQQGKDNLAKEIAELLANDGTTWHFIPPRMPTHGGLWEAGVQSAKRHLTRVNKDTKLTYEEMSTLLAQVEACLNSRPLCPIDNTTDTVLTPGHFLVGEPLISVPEINYEEVKIHILTRWQLIQRMTQDFWRRWQAEYLNTLQQRYKWQIPVPSPAVGDLVIVKEDDTPPTKWLLGRIKHLHPGSDNLVRVVTVQCKGNHELKRPLYKLIPLPSDT